MMNAFERLGLQLGLVVSEEEVRDGFRKVAAELHPDSGGDAGEFAALQVAQEVLLSPGKRLKEWVLANGLEIDSRGSIGGELMDLFQEVATVGAAAEEAVKAAEKAQSILAKAMAEVRTIAEQGNVKDLLARVEGEIAGREETFPAVEKGNVDAAEVMRDLVFLEKWRATLRGLYGRLI
ncbi:MAG: hypothetical protein ACSHX7_07570 [Luteolibacter sp.]